MGFFPDLNQQQSFAGLLGLPFRRRRRYRWEEKQPDFSALQGALSQTGTLEEEPLPPPPQDIIEAAEGEKGGGGIPVVGDLFKAAGTVLDFPRKAVQETIGDIGVAVTRGDFSGFTEWGQGREWFDKNVREQLPDPLRIGLDLITDPLMYIPAGGLVTKAGRLGIWAARMSRFETGPLITAVEANRLLRGGARLGRGALELLEGVGPRGVPIVAGTASLASALGQQVGGETGRGIGSLVGLFAGTGIAFRSTMQAPSLLDVAAKEADDTGLDGFQRLFRLELEAERTRPNLARPRLLTEDGRIRFPEVGEGVVYGRESWGDIGHSRYFAIWEEAAREIPEERNWTRILRKIPGVNKVHEYFDPKRSVRIKLAERTAGRARAEFIQHTMNELSPVIQDVRTIVKRLGGEDAVRRLYRGPAWRRTKGTLADMMANRKLYELPPELDEALNALHERVNRIYSVARQQYGVDVSPIDWEVVEREFAEIGLTHEIAQQVLNAQNQDEALEALLSSQKYQKKLGKAKREEGMETVADALRKELEEYRLTGELTPGLHGLMADLELTVTIGPYLLETTNPFSAVVLYRKSWRYYPNALIKHYDDTETLQRFRQMLSARSVVRVRTSADAEQYVLASGSIPEELYLGVDGWERFAELFGGVVHDKAYRELTGGLSVDDLMQRPEFAGQAALKESIEKLRKKRASLRDRLRKARERSFAEERFVERATQKLPETEEGVRAADVVEQIVRKTKQSTISASEIPDIASRLESRVAYALNQLQIGKLTAEAAVGPQGQRTVEDALIEAANLAKRVQASELSRMEAEQLSARLDEIRTALRKRARGKGGQLVRGVLIDLTSLHKTLRGVLDRTKGIDTAARRFSSLADRIQELISEADEDVPVNIATFLQANPELGAEVKQIVEDIRLYADGVRALFDHGAPADWREVFEEFVNRYKRIADDKRVIAIREGRGDPVMALEVMLAAKGRYAERTGGQIQKYIDRLIGKAAEARAVAADDIIRLAEQLTQAQQPEEIFRLGTEVLHGIETLARENSLAAAKAFQQVQGNLSRAIGRLSQAQEYLPQVQAMQERMRQAAQDLKELRDLSRSALKLSRAEARYISWMELNVDRALERMQAAAERATKLSSDIRNTNNEIKSLGNTLKGFTFPGWSYVMETRRWHPIEDAKAIREYLQQRPNSELMRVYTALSDEVRGLKLVTDLEPLSVRYLSYLIHRPTTLLRELWTATKFPGGVHAYLQETISKADPQRLRAFARYTGRAIGALEPEFSAAKAHAGLGRFKAVERLERWQFGLLDVARFNIWSHEVDNLVRRGVDVETAYKRAADFVNDISPYIIPHEHGWGRLKQKEIRGLVTSVSYFGKPMKVLNDAVAGFVKYLYTPGTPGERWAALLPREQNALRVLSVWYVGLAVPAAMNNAILAMRDGDDPLEAIQRTLTPGTGDFLAWKIPGGQRISFGGPYRGAIQLFARVVASPETSAQTLANFTRNRTMIIPSTVASLLMNSDWRGDSIYTRWQEALIYAVEQTAVPISVGNLIESYRHGDLFRHPKDAVLETALSQLGGNVSGVTPFQRFNQAAREEFGRDYRELEPWERAELKRRRPELWEEVASKFDPVRFQAERAKMTHYEAQVEDDISLLKGQLTVYEWRERMRMRAERMAAINQSAYGPGGKGGDTPLDAYYRVIRAATSTDGEVDWEKVDSWLATLPQDERDYILRNTGITRTPLGRLYREAMETYGRALRVPKYKGYTVKEGEAIDQLLQDIPSRYPPYYNSLPEKAKQILRLRLAREIAQENPDLYPENVLSGARRVILGQLREHPERDRIMAEEPLIKIFFSRGRLSSEQRRYVLQRLGESGTDMAGADRYLQEAQ